MKQFLKMSLLCITISCATSQSDNESSERINSDSPSFLDESIVQLATPYIQANQTIFKNATQLKITAPMPESIVRYTLDSSEPDNTAPIAGSSMTISRSGIYHFKAFHPEYQTSEAVSLEFLQLSESTPRIEISSAQHPNENYSADGWQTLTDLNRGTSNFHDNWMGFQNDIIELNIQFNQVTEINEVLIGLMSNQSAWIFLPERIEVQSQNEIRNSKILTEAQYKSDPEQPWIKIETNALRTDQLTIKIYSLGKIPDWHDGKGTPPWTFIDEIIVQ